MKRYIITSPKYTGEINVLYGLDNKLLFIDFMKCDLTEEQIAYFKTKLPIFFSENFAQAFGTSKLNIMEEGFSVTFDQFWGRYNLKHNKIRCLKAWGKLTEADQANAYFKLPFYERYLRLNSWRTKAEAETYLKDRYWESEWK